MLENMKTKREEHGMALGPDGKIYAIGGFDGKQCLKAAERFNLQTGKWEMIAPLQIARRSLSAVALADGVYAIGGFDGKNFLSSVEKYDIENDKWITIQSLNQERCSMACVASSDYREIYVLGGYNGASLGSVECYNVVKGAWKLVAPMTHKRFMHAAVFITKSI